MDRLGARPRGGQTGVRRLLAARHVPQSVGERFQRGDKLILGFKAAVCCARQWQRYRGMARDGSLQAYAIALPQPFCGAGECAMSRALKFRSGGEGSVLLRPRGQFLHHARLRPHIFCLRVVQAKRGGYALPFNQGGAGFGAAWPYPAAVSAEYVGSVPFVPATSATALAHRLEGPGAFGAHGAATMWRRFWRLPPELLRNFCDPASQSLRVINVDWFDDDWRHAERMVAFQLGRHCEAYFLWRLVLATSIASRDRPTTSTQTRPAIRKSPDLPTADARREARRGLRPARPAMRARIALYAGTSDHESRRVPSAAVGRSGGWISGCRAVTSAWRHGSCRSTG